MNLIDKLYSQKIIDFFSGICPILVFLCSHLLLVNFKKQSHYFFFSCVYEMYWIYNCIIYTAASFLYSSMSLSGMLIGCMNALDQLKVEGIVDVFQIVRRIKIVDSQFVDCVVSDTLTRDNVNSANGADNYFIKS